jgi:hypothetical protein
MPGNDLVQIVSHQDPCEKGTAKQKKSDQRFPMSFSQFSLPLSFPIFIHPFTFQTAAKRLAECNFFIFVLFIRLLN